MVADSGAPGRSQEQADLGKRSFEDLMNRLEEVVESLEAGKLPLERSLELFEEGVRLSRHASGRLDSAERKIEELLASGSQAIVSDTKTARPGGEPPTGF